MAHMGIKERIDKDVFGDPFVNVQIADKPRQTIQKLNVAPVTGRIRNVKPAWVFFDPDVMRLAPFLKRRHCSLSRIVEYRQP